jgi:hypothetical protein
MNNNHRIKQIFYDSTYLFVNLVNYISISNLVKLLRCDKRLYRQIHITYGYITYPISLVVNWEKQKHKYIKNLQFDDAKFMNNVHLFPNAKSIIFDDNFNRTKLLPIKETLIPIEKRLFPDGLTHLTFENEFNKPIKKGIFPNSLFNLTFGVSFNQSIEKGVFPDSLSNLTFGYDFNQRNEKDVLPNSLLNLTFGHKFNQRIEKNVLPNSLTNLIN